MFEIGQTFTLSTPVTAEDAVQTALLSQDTQPLHLDPGFAARTHFGRPIAPGVVVIGRVGALLGTRLVDAQTHYIVTEQFAVRFVRPVFAGDALTVRATVKTWDAERQRVSVDLDVRNQRQRRVLGGTASLMVFSLGGGPGARVPEASAGSQNEAGSAELPA
jgi:3-hydroxybutyryl-CoA dehydratase